MAMKLARTVNDARSMVSELKSGMGSFGLVPTMGALHRGHISLIERSVADNEKTGVSIFVNPTQFNEKQDFESYPRNLDEDLEILNEFHVDLVFAPSPEEIYPDPDTRNFDFGGLDRVMEGVHRPGHFNGVAQVVSRLFEILSPDRAYFGEKDFQQLAIIRKMTGDLGLPVELIGCPIIREEDGLAMSSRNKLLTAEERSSATRLSAALYRAKERAGNTDPGELIRETLNYLNEDPLIETEYFEIVDARLEPVEAWREGHPLRACLAVKIGKVRLIDNIEFSF